VVKVGVWCAMSVNKNVGYVFFLGQKFAKMLTTI